MTTQLDKAKQLQALHEGPGTFLAPGPWDVGSARVFEAFGFKALATTSGGFAFSIGKNDGEVTLDEKVEHCRALSAATQIPISADLENGYADAPEAVAETIRRIAESGVVGGSIEDWSGADIYDFDLAVDRHRRGRERPGRGAADLVHPTGERATCRGDRNASLGHGSFERIEPCAVGVPAVLAQQPLEGGAIVNADPTTGRSKPHAPLSILNHGTHYTVA